MATIDSCRDDRRQFPRYRLDHATRLRPNEWSTLQVELLDISTGGFRINCDANLKIGGYVTLEVHGIGLVEARIVWRRGQQVGAQFARPIRLEHCAWVREQIDEGQQPYLSVPDEDLFELLARRAARRAAGA